MIYTVTLNPSLDYVMHLNHFQMGKTNRSNREEVYPGGKGINVSTMLAHLGVSSTALGFVGGFTGQEIKKQLVKRGIQLDLCELDEGVSRINVKLKGHLETEINGAGPDIAEEKLNELFQKLERIKTGDVLIMAGSIPATLPENLYEKMMLISAKKGILNIVDATGQQLLHTLPHHPFLIKPNRDELEEILHCSLKSIDDFLAAAEKLQELGARHVLISLGQQGAILVTETKTCFQCPAAKGTLVNSVGSGDSMIAGFVAGYLQTQDLTHALALGSACGGATAFSADLGQYDQVMAILPTLSICRIP